MAGDENNNWLNDTPTEGDSTGGFPSGGGIDVRPDGVKLFSTQADGEARNFSSNYADGVAPLTEQVGRIGASFQEAAYFTGQHGQGVQTVGLLGQDVSIGLTALGMGARTIAINYLNADATSAATLPDVVDAFDASSGNGLRDMVNQSGELSPTGQDNPMSLPEAEPVTAEDFAGGDTEDETIALGSNDEYTIPGDSPDDIELLDYNDDLAPLEQQHRDDLGQVDYEAAPYDPGEYR